MRSLTTLWPPVDLVLNFGGGGGGPSAEALAKQSAEQKKAQRLAQMQADRQAGLQEKQLAAQQKMLMDSIESAPEAVTTPPPPSAQTSSDIEDASQLARQAAGKRFGLGKTTFAGGTGGYMAGATPLGSSNAGGRPQLG
jgi:hypothetical protein